jgi:uncharacterized HAD superfamily protein
MRIAFDLDDTLAQTCEAVLADINDQLGTNVEVSAMTSTKWEDVIPAVTFPLIKGIFEAGIFARLEPVAGAVEFVNALATEGHELFVITDRYWNADDLDVTIDWLSRHGFPTMEVILCKSNAKAALAQEKGIELFFEDRVANANSIAEAGVQVRLRTIANNIFDTVVDGVVRYLSY